MIMIIFLTSIAINMIIELVRYYRDTYAEHPEDRKNIEYSVLFKMMIMTMVHFQIDKTGFKLMVTLQSGCVPEILTLCRMNKIFFFQKYH